ncbi:DUF4169 family protein [Aureimonas mangrovi]|uniref:DUF4169 family protein n=1 Tax=Aureimonas mangrovi TaxID=2758041 RepID=UPI00163D68FD|nr:DUF4169 family protein [Aureimonas mangrovi]
MAEIVNLRQARKTRERAAREAQAAENRQRYGLTKPQKAKAGSEREKLLAALDGAKLDRAATAAKDEPER